MFESKCSFLDYTVQTSTFILRQLEYISAPSIGLNLYTVRTGCFASLPSYEISMDMDPGLLFGLACTEQTAI
jgi:hypothetical protein